MGEGEGVKDVSEQIQDEDQLLGAQQKDKPPDAPKVTSLALSCCRGATPCKLQHAVCKAEHVMMAAVLGASGGCWQGVGGGGGHQGH
jgi:hypothetical protein